MGEWVGGRAKFEGGSAVRAALSLPSPARAPVSCPAPLQPPAHVKAPPPPPPPLAALLPARCLPPVRALFAVAAQLAPSVVFIDEIDSLLSLRKNDGEHEVGGGGISSLGGPTREEEAFGPRPPPPLCFAGA